MNNNTNPNKRRANFNTQQRRGAKRQKLNQAPPMSTRGRGRMQRGRGHPRLKLRRGGSYIRGGRGSYRGRGHMNPNQITRTLHGANTNPSATSPPQHSVARLRAKLLADQKAKASLSPQKTAPIQSVTLTAHPSIIPGATTPDQIEKQQRKKRLIAKRHVQKASTSTAAHVQLPDALKTLRAQALKSMDKKKTNPIQAHTTPPKSNPPRRPTFIKRNILSAASPTKMTQSLNPNAAVFNSNASKSNPQVSTTAANAPNIPRRQLKSYRQGPKTKDNISFTTTVFDINHNVVQTTISTTDQSSPHKPSKPMAPKPIMNIPPQIVPDAIVKKPSIPVPAKRTEPTKQVVPKPTAAAVHLPKAALNWACDICTFHNEGNKSMKCSMCHEVNTIKKAISKATNKPLHKKQIQTKIIPKKTPKPIHTNAAAQTSNARGVSLSKNVMSMEAVWKQRERAMQEMQRQKKDNNINTKLQPPKSKQVSVQPQVVVPPNINKAPVLHHEAQIKKVIRPMVDKSTLPTKKILVKETAECVETKPSVSRVTEAVKEIQKVVAPKPKPKAKPVYALPSLKECWRWDVNKKISDMSLKGFIQETDVFIERMNVDLKTECKAIGVEYRNPFEVENECLMVDVSDDFECTKKMCNENGVVWPKDFDMNAFSKVVTQCNAW